MSDYRFYHPIEVRYGDLDPQGHLNNAKYLTYFEQARLKYFVHLGLFQPTQSFMDIGIIMADVHLTYHAPVLWNTAVKVGVRISRIGNKSLTVEQCMIDANTDHPYASGTVILVAYDYHRHQTIPVPEEWREAIARFEGLKVSVS